MDVKNKKLVFLFTGGFLFSYLILVLVSSLYFRAPVVNPVTAWHGATSAVGSVFSDSKLSIITHTYQEKEFVVAAGYSNEDFEQQAYVALLELDLKDQLESSKARMAQLEEGQDRLSQINQQLLGSKSTLDSLNQDYSALISNNHVEASVRVDIQAALDSDIVAPSEEEVQTLISNRGRASRPSGSVRQSVLDNVEASTGISSERIRELFDKQ